MSKEIVEVTTYEEDINTIKDITTKAFLISGKILLSIQEDKKYKENGYKTFAEAVKIDLGLATSRAYQLIDASITYQNVHNCGQNLPQNEAQLRPLTALSTDKQEAVWLEASKEGVPTAKKVKDTILQLYPPDYNCRLAVAYVNEYIVVEDLPEDTPRAFDSQQEQIDILTKNLERSRASNDMLQNMVDELQVVPKLPTSSGIPTFPPSCNNDELTILKATITGLKHQLEKSEQDNNTNVRIAEEVLLAKDREISKLKEQLQITNKVQKTHEEERQQAIANSNKINKDIQVAFNKRLKEDGISKSVLVV